MKLKIWQQQSSELRNANLIHGTAQNVKCVTVLYTVGLKIEIHEIHEIHQNLRNPVSILI